MYVEKHQEPGRSCWFLLKQVRLSNRRKGRRMTSRKSDQLIVLGGRDTSTPLGASHGEGADRITKSAQETCAGHAGSDNT